MAALELNKIIPPSLIAVEGKYVTFKCSSFSKPVWTFNGGNLPMFAHVLSNGFLVIEKIQVRHRGYYECKGRNRRNEKFISKAILKVRGNVMT